MKLQLCIDIAKECKLTTLGEAYDNVKLLSIDLFTPENMEKELQELRNEIGQKYNLTEITDNINGIKL